MSSPPSRPAHLFDAEQGEPVEAAQSSLLRRIALFVDPPLAFGGETEGVIQTLHYDDISARFSFRCGLGEGVIDLSSDARGWLRADISVPKAHLRVWLEQAYEEIEFWPDGADGVGDAPGRISKRGSWLSLDCARFPGMPVTAGGFWSVEEIET